MMNRKLLYFILGVALGGVVLAQAVGPVPFDIINLTTGLRIGGAATSGEYLRGNGTNFVSNTIQAGDLPTGFVDNVADISASLCTASQVLKKNAGNTAWECAADATGAGGGAGVFLTWSANQAVQAGTGTLATQDTRNGHPVLDFDAAADECSYFHGVLANDYASGGLTIDLFWMATSATTGSVTWLAAVERHAIDTDDLDSDSFAADNSATCVTASATGEKDLCTVTFTDGADMDSLAAGEAFRLRVCRDGDGSVGTDDMAGDAELANISVRET